MSSNQFVGTLDAIAESFPIATNPNLYEYLPGFSAQYNGIEGTIPDRLHWSLSELHLAVNRLSGDFPAAAFANTSIQYGLELSSNLLTGTLPSQCSSTWVLNLLHLSNNLMHGPLPDGNSTFWCSIISLNLADNRFSGDIPMVKRGIHLLALDLSGNEFVKNCLI